MIKDDFSNYFDNLKKSLTKISYTPKELKKKGNYDKEFYFTMELLRIVVNRFIYDDLPYDINSEILENFFTMSKYVVAQYDDKLRFYRANMSGKMNIYGIAESGQAYAVNGATFNFNINDNDIVLFYDTIYTNTDFYTIRHYAEILNNIYMAYMLSINNQKVSRIFGCSKDTLLSAQNLNDKINSGEKVIYLSNTANITDIKEFDLSAQFNCDKLKDLFRNEFKEFLNRFGIEDFANDSRERLVSDEVHSADNYIELNRNVALEKRIKFCNEINRKFGTNLKVSFNSNLSTEVNRATAIMSMLSQTGGNEDE